jgi:hypothetical protein
MEEWRSAATADTMEEWWSAAAANALEVNR